MLTALNIMEMFCFDFFFNIVTMERLLFEHFYFHSNVLLLSSNNFVGVFVVVVDIVQVCVLARNFSVLKIKWQEKQQRPILSVARGIVKEIKRSTEQTMHLERNKKEPF